MDNYEVNVLTRKGGWKKLPQEIFTSKNELQNNKSDNLDINVTDDTSEMDDLQNFDNNLFENFTEINKIIKKLKAIEYEKNNLINELDELMKNFKSRKESLDSKLTNIQKEKEMYDKAIDLIVSLKGF